MLPHLFPPQPTPPTPTIQTQQQTVAHGLHVEGNKLLNEQDKEVILRGVDRSGTEYQCVKGNGKIFDGPSDEASIQAMKSWHINAVRVPLNEDCWLGINNASPSGILYQQAITSYVKLITKNNMYAIIDLHWSAPGTTLATSVQIMADRDHSLAFWTSAAKNFKNDPHVLFDLYNEPRGISWDCWKDGTGCDTPFQVASMQEMIDTVRATGANNVILLGGLESANDLSGFLSHEPSDPANNLAVSWHMYGKNTCDTTECWDRTVAPVMAMLPVVATEFGESYDSSVCGTKLSDAFMQWMDQRQAGYLGWAWDTWSPSCGDLSLITDYNGTPKVPNGVNYKNHLEQF